MRTRLLSEELLQSLMEAGQTDVLVGLPTRNHAATAGRVVQAVLGAFRGRFIRERTVLLNLDGGSTDGTPELVRHALAQPGELVATEYTLRSIHRITAPYHGMPERSTALRVLFTAADLLRVRAVVVLDPTAPSTREDVEDWIGAVLTKQADYVKPRLPRRWDEGPLVTQLVRPLLSAAYGFELLEPIDTQLSCSGAFAVDALTRDFWTLPEAEVGIDTFLSAHAMSRRYRLAQVATQAQAHPEPGQRLSVSAVFAQVVSALLACLAHAPEDWLPLREVAPVPTENVRKLAPRAEAPRFDVAELGRAFRLGVEALPALLSPTLGSALYARLTEAARSTPPRLSDELWADVVYACVGATLRRQLPVGRVAQLLEPIYLGRVASHLGRGPNPGRDPGREDSDGDGDGTERGALAAAGVAPLAHTFAARKVACSESWSRQREEQ